MAFKRDSSSFKLPKTSFKAQSFSRTPLPEQPLHSMEYTGDPEQDSQKELELTLEALQNKERTKALRDAIRITTDSEYWCALCFETREQKEFFLKALELFEHGDKYIDGLIFAERMGIELPKADLPYRSAARINKRLEGLVKD